MAEPFGTFTSRVIPLPAENVDTDQIVPARYLKVTDKDGLAEALFRDWRFEEDGSLREPRFVIDQPEMAGRQILLVGDNFGAGSSREHAPWALTAWGIRAILSTSFADIFRNNSLKNGLLPIAVEERPASAPVRAHRRQPGHRADRRPRGPGRPPARRRGPPVRGRPVRPDDAARRDRRARLPAGQAARDRGLGSRPTRPGRHGRGRLTARTATRRPARPRRNPSLSAVVWRP